MTEPAVDRPARARTRPARRSAQVGVLVGLVALSLASCGGGGGGSDAAPTTTAAKQPAGCDAAPFSIELGAGDGAKAAPFEVKESAAQRVAVLPGKMAFDASEMAGLTSQAGVTPLGAYSVYVTDGAVPTDALTGSGYGTVTDGSATVAAVRILPTAEGGFTEGEVVATTSSLGYETRTDQQPLMAGIAADGADLELTDDVTGTVTVLQVSDETICVDIDVTIPGDGGGVVSGIVEAPVVRAADAFFLT